MVDRVRIGDDQLLCKHSFSLIFNDRQSKWTEITPYLPNNDVDAEAAIVKLIDQKRVLDYTTNGHRSKNFSRSMSTTQSLPASINARAHWTALCALPPAESRSSAR